MKDYILKTLISSSIAATIIIFFGAILYFGIVKDNPLTEKEHVAIIETGILSDNLYALIHPSIQVDSLPEYYKELRDINFHTIQIQEFSILNLSDKIIYDLRFEWIAYYQRSTPNYRRDKLICKCRYSGEGSWKDLPSPRFVYELVKNN